MKKYMVIFMQFVLCIIIGVVFGNSLFNDFVWDDKLYTSNNVIYKNFDIIKIFTTLANGLEYLPIRDLSYAIDHAIGSGRPLIFHCSNLLVYIFVVLSVYAYACACYRLIYHSPSDALENKSRMAGFLTALFFAVHPIHCEVVNFITCRNALLSTLFFFISAFIFIGLLSEERSKKYILISYSSAFVLFVFSLFSKATSIILPLILVLQILYVNRKKSICSVLSTVPFLVMSVASFFLMTSIAAKATIIGNNIEDWTYNGLITKTARALQITVFYLWKLLYPYGYSVAYDTVFAWSLTDKRVIIISIALPLVLMTSFLLRKKAPYLMFGIFWYLITLIPVLNFFATKPVVADRYAFLPSFAFFFVLACVAVQLSEKVKPLIVIIILLVVAGYLGGLSVQRNRVWVSEESLWSATINTSPKSLIGYRNLGNIYLVSGDRDRALASFLPIADADPCYYYTLGLSAYQNMDYANAKEYLVKSLGRDVMFIASLYYLGMVYEHYGDNALAAEMYQQAIRSRQPDGGQFKAHATERLKMINR